MALIQYAEAQEILNPYNDGLHEAITGGVSDYVNYPESVKAIHCPRTRASTIHDHIWARTKANFDNDPNVRFCESNQLMLLLIADLLLVRFKKLNEDKMSKNQPTEQVKMYRSQQRLPGLPELVHLEAGYIYDDLDHSVKDVCLVCPNGKSHYWFYSLANPQETATVRDLFEREDAEEGTTIFTPKHRGEVVPLRKQHDDEDSDQ